jgi:hypothetical protein
MRFITDWRKYACIGADMTRLERVQSPQHVQDGLLDQIAGIELAARRGRQLSVCPPPQMWKAPLQERLDRLPIAVLRADHQARSSARR